MNCWLVNDNMSTQAWFGDKSCCVASNPRHFLEAQAAPYFNGNIHKWPSDSRPPDHRNLGKQIKRLFVPFVFLCELFVLLVYYWSKMAWECSGMVSDITFVFWGISKFRPNLELRTPYLLQKYFNENTRKNVFRNMLCCKCEDLKSGFVWTFRVPNFGNSGIWNLGTLKFWNWNVLPTTY